MSVRVTYKPIKEIVILEAIRYSSVEDFVRSLEPALKAGQPVVLLWAEGIVLQHSPLPPTTEFLVKEHIKGRVYWSHVAYAPMPKYESTIKVGALEIPIIKAEAPALIEAARWLKARAGGR